MPFSKRVSASVLIIAGLVGLQCEAAERADTIARRAAVPAVKSVLIAGVPHVAQKPDFCGEACAAMYLRKLGWTVGQDYVFNQSGLDPLEARGCFTKELAAALEKIGFRPGQIWYKVPASKNEVAMEAQWKALYEDLAAGVPSIICTHYDASPGATEHFRLVLGYDAKKDEVVYHEPAEASGAYRRMPRATLLALWPLKYDAKQSTLIRLRLEPSPQMKAARPPRPHPSDTFTPADYAQHLIALKRKIPAEGFTVLIEPPFVVIGDESPKKVRQRAEGTVKWAVDKLKAAYFSKDPAEILDIWLFKDKESYEEHCQSIFHSKPDTPFGYFSSTDRALIMNISTGGGTLVHEIVHPFIAANFPQCPAWFNEGLGSLYEQSGEEDGEIHGYTNWRLPGLQEAIRKKRTVPFKTLCGTTTNEFYSSDRGSNYSQARYLCYYLQQKGLLRQFYREFVKNHSQDPGGYETLKAVLQRDDVDEFQKDWEAWVLKLRF